MKTGWHSSGGIWYYLDSNGRMVTNVTLNIGGKDYIFDTNGKCTNPEVLNCTEYQVLQKFDE